MALFQKTISSYFVGESAGKTGIAVGEAGVGGPCEGCSVAELLLQTGKGNILLRLHQGSTLSVLLKILFKVPDLFVKSGVVHGVEPVLRWQRGS